MGASPSQPSESTRNELSRKRDEIIERAAIALAHSDAIVLFTGAGWSADSGLAVYADVADIEAYHKRGLKYHDICVPDWLQDEPELFYGFWGKCFNDYRDATPHEGYKIVAKWRDALCRNTSLASELKAASGAPGSFFCFTSNVDAHSLRHFSPLEVRECHGNNETWQCAKRQCCTSPVTEPACEPKEGNGGADLKRWSAPAGFRFHVQRENMHAPSGPPAKPPTPTMDVASSPLEVAAFQSNWPSCLKCGGNARPSILMFQDVDWVDDTEQRERWKSWCSALQAACKRPLRVTIIEAGAGGNVTTVRNQSEDLMQSIKDAGGTAYLIRINPDLPLADIHRNQSRLSAIRAIDEAMQKAQTRLDEAELEQLACPPHLSTVTERAPEDVDEGVDAKVDAQSQELFNKVDDINSKLLQSLQTLDQEIDSIKEN